LRNAARREACIDKDERLDLLRVRRNSRLVKGGRREKKPRETPYKNIRCLMYIGRSDERETTCA